MIYEGDPTNIHTISANTHNSSFGRLANFEILLLNEGEVPLLWWPSVMAVVKNSISFCLG